MKNCETCGIEVNVVMTPFADEVTGFIGENGVTCLKCAGLVEEATDGELAEEMGVGLRNAWGEEDCDDDYCDRDDYEDGYEDNAETMQREYADHKSELYERWKREY